MRNITKAVAALIVASTPAMAADMQPRMYAKAPPAMDAGPPVYTWTGFYVGGHLGGAFSDRNNTLGGDDRGRFMGGGQIGADYQFSGSWLAGIEANYSYLDRGNSVALAFPGGTFNHNLRGLASVTGRLGYVWGPGVVYAKGGYAYADTRTNGVGPFAFDGRRDGYTIGGGAEYMFAQNWSAKIEYQYYDFGRNQLRLGAPLAVAGNFREEEHTIKLGVNYHFNFASPLAPRY